MTAILTLKEFFANHDAIRSHLRRLFPKKTSWRWVDMAVLLIRIKLYYADCHPGAKFVMQECTLAGQSANPRIFWRLVKWLENRDLLQRSRRLRANGSWTTNVYNLNPLMHLLSILLASPSTEVKVAGNDIWVKHGGLWREFNSLESKSA